MSKRSLNPVLWAGFAVVLLGVFSYVPVFIRYPLTRDFPWVNLLLLAAGLALIAVGLKRAYVRPDDYRGRISGVLLAVLAAGLTGLFCYGSFHFARQLPSSGSAPHPGEAAPDFTLLNSAGNAVTLRNLLAGNRGVLLIFYRGYW